ncbi:hypothetical protein F406_gp034 [Agrobacterium phage 7-7-1]|uniref:Uncharacterized protein n=1 Tax=Agrobacterium phage 7-7-1 TaxID=1161931 RepID=J7FAF4_9CAUD|nr:hypothetical protein F406_gp034 [Agrobacterium phage 7-7-1]AFH19781.1 hypothetical protein 7-7-1_00083 [Agrobacterium phage 7-7-1]
MEESIKYWQSVESFTFRGDHLMSAQDVEFGSRIICERNDGRTFHFYFGDRSFVASNIGDMDVLINYDVRPNISGYNFVDGRYVPHPNGDVKIEGDYPNYHIAGLFIPVHIGPHLYFYPERQEDIIYLAKSGQLLAPSIHVRRQCITCRRDIPKSVGPRAQYCSVECGLVTRDMLRRKQAARAEVMKFKLPEIKPVRRCLKCDGPMPKGSAGRARYCSVECGLVTAAMQRETKQHPCEHCGKPFTRFGRQRFCSEICKVEEKLKCLKS